METLKHYLEFEKKSGHSENTVIAYSHDIQTFTDFLLDNNIRDINQVSRNHIDNFIENNNFVLTTKRRKVSAIKYFFLWAYKNKHLEEFKEEQLFPKIKIRTESFNKVLSPEDKNLLVTEARKNLKHHALVMLIFASGERISEIIQISTQDITKKGEQLEIAFTGKNKLLNKKSILLDEETSKIVENYIQQNKKRISKSGFLFPHNWESHLGKPKLDHMKRQGAWIIIKDLANRAGISTTVTPSVLRNTSSNNIYSGFRWLVVEARWPKI